MKTILINNKIYVLSDNIISITKNMEPLFKGKVSYFIVFKYVNGEEEKEFFKTKEKRDTVFNEILAIIKGE